MYDAVIGALMQVPAFESIQEPVLAQLAAACCAVRFSTKSVLFKSGEEASAMYAIHHGAVRLTRGTRFTRSQTIATERDGGLVGELGLVSGRYAMDAEAVQPTDAIMIRRDAFQELSSQHPELAAAAAHLAAYRAQSTIEKLERLALPVPARVAELLLEWLPDDTYRTLPCSQEDIGRELATTRESVVRAFSALKTTGALEQHGKAYRIADRERMQHMAQRNGLQPELAT